MIKRQPLMTYDQDEVSLKHSRHLLGINYQACSKGKQCHCKNQLIIPYDQKAKLEIKHYQSITTW